MDFRVSRWWGRLEHLIPWVRTSIPTYPNKVSLVWFQGNLSNTFRFPRKKVLPKCLGVPLRMVFRWGMRFTEFNIATLKKCNHSRLKPIYVRSIVHSRESSCWYELMFFALPSFGWPFGSSVGAWTGSLLPKCQLV